MQKLPCVLLVDDDQTTNYLNTKLIERMGIADQVLVALNGQEALGVLLTRCQPPSTGVVCPVLVFLDVKMPVMDGFEFLTAYQQLPLVQQQAIIIVMLTTSLHPQDVQRIEQLPIAGFLSKPLTQEKVDQVLRTKFEQYFLNSI